MSQLGFTFDEGALPAPTPRHTDALESRLRVLLGPYVVLKLTSNKSTMISFSHRGRVLYVRAHSIFATATDPIVEALAAFVSQPRIPRKQSMMLDEYIERHRPKIEREKRDQPIQPIGESHDLSMMFDKLNAQYFDGAIKARISWSIAASKKRRSSIKMGSYSHDESLIRIHPALDQAWVPKYFVAFVVFHEMLHESHGAPDMGCGRRRVHPPEFRADEKKFDHYERSIAWEEKNLGRLLKY